MSRITHATQRNAVLRWGPNNKPYDQFPSTAEFLHAIFKVSASAVSGDALILGDS